MSCLEVHLKLRSSWSLHPLHKLCCYGKNKACKTTNFWKCKFFHFQIISICGLTSYATNYFYRHRPVSDFLLHKHALTDFMFFFLLYKVFCWKCCLFTYLCLYHYRHNLSGKIISTINLVCWMGSREAYRKPIFHNSGKWTKTKLMIQSWGENCPKTYLLSSL